jgi:drug/metabolite transporter (DMT)-like permease
MTINRRNEYALLALLALFWGSSYLFIKVAVAEILPLTLIALRVSGASALLFLVLAARREMLPRGGGLWVRLGVQSLLNSTAAWTLLAWGQQHVDAGLASVLNSTSPIFVFLFTALVTRHEATGGRKFLGAVLGLVGVVLIVGVDALAGLGLSVAGQLACLVGAMMYAGAAIYGKRFAGLGALQTALGTLLWATAVLVPAAFLFEDPLVLTPSPKAMAATAMLSVFCTGVAMLIYFRLIHTLGSLGVASQSYLRAGVGVILGVIVLGEVITPVVMLGLLAAIVGVAMINAPARPR